MFDDLNTLTTHEHVDARFYERSLWASSKWLGITGFMLLVEVNAAILLARRGTQMPWLAYSVVIVVCVALLLQWARIWIEHRRLRASGEPFTNTAQRADSALRGLFKFAIVVFATLQLIQLIVFR